MGTLTALLAALLSSSKDLVSKKLSFSLDGTSSAFASFAFALPYYGVLLLVLYLAGYENFSVPSSFWLLVLLRASTDTCAEWMKMVALTKGDISLLSSVVALSPLFVLVNAPLITGDTISVTGTIAVVVIVCGSVLILWNPKPKNGAVSRERNAVGIVLALGAAFFFSLNHCFDRLAAQQASPVISGFAMTALAALFLLPFMLWKDEGVRIFSGHKKPPLVRGLFEVSFMVAKLSALQFLSAQFVVGIMRTSVVFSVIGGRVLFKEEDFLRRVTASLFVLIGVAVIGYFEL